MYGKKYNNYTLNRFVSSTKIYVIGRVIQSLANLVLLIFLLRVMSKADYGAYMALLGLIEVMVPLTSFGLFEIARRYIPEITESSKKEDLSKFIVRLLLFRLSMVMTFCYLLYLSWFSISAWMNYEGQHSTYGILAVSLVFSTLMLRYLAEVLECLLAQKYSQLVRIIYLLGQLIGVIIAYNYYQELTFYTVILVANIFVAFSLSLSILFLYKKIKYHKFEENKQINYSEIIRFIWHLTGANILQTFASYGLVRMVIANQLGLEAAGVFGFLHQLLNVASRYLPSNFIQNLIRPMLVTRYTISKDYKVINNGINILWKSNIIIISAYVLSTYVIGDRLIQMLSDGKVESAGMLMTVMFFLLFSTSQRQLLEMTLQILDKTKELRNISLILPIMPICVWLGAKYDLLGVVISLVIFSWIWNFLMLRVIRGWSKVKIMMWSTISKLLIFILTLFLLVFIASKYIPEGMMMFLIITLMFKIVLEVKPFNLDEFAVINKVLKGKQTAYIEKLVS